MDKIGAFCLNMFLCHDYASNCGPSNLKGGLESKSNHSITSQKRETKFYIPNESWKKMYPSERKQFSHLNSNKRKFDWWNNHKFEIETRACVNSPISQSQKNNSQTIPDINEEDGSNCDEKSNTSNCSVKVTWKDPISEQSVIRRVSRYIVSNFDKKIQVLPEHSGKNERPELN